MRYARFGEARRRQQPNVAGHNVAKTGEHAATRVADSRPGAEIGIDGILAPDGARLDQAARDGAPELAANTDEQVTRKICGRTVARGGRARLEHGDDQALPRQPHARRQNFGISNPHAYSNKLNEYSPTARRSRHRMAVRGRWRARRSTSDCRYK